ncbi:MAG: hypothetical protein AAFX87_27775 [Bacteroidota bacterium]
MKDEFYIGWSEETPRSYSIKGRAFFLTSFIAMLLVGVIYVINQKPYANSEFQYGNIQEITGILVKKPAWGIKTKIGGKHKTVLLVGLGKFGPEMVLSSLIQKGKLKAGQEVTFRGQLFHYQGKYGMELTEMEDSFVSATDQLNSSERNINKLGTTVLEGEIVDAKCFFGVMNPAIKSIHRSCAIRCISGGIPAVLGIREDGEFVDYYILESDSEELNRKILPYVGVPVKLIGLVHHYDDWKSLDIELDNIELVSETQTEMMFSRITTCR